MIIIVAGRTPTAETEVRKHERLVISLIANALTTQKGKWNVVTIKPEDAGDWHLILEEKKNNSHP